MHRNKLLNLLASNRKRGEFRAETADTGNVIYLYDVIVASKVEAEWWGGVDAETFVQSLRGMSGDVTLRINCPGGDVFAGRAMAQAIRDYPGQVTAHVDGYAASAASFITSAADRVVMADGSMLMIHKAWTMAWGNTDDLTATAQLLGKIDGTIAATYESAAKKRGVTCSAAEFTVLMAAETWFTGPEAIDHGLADEVAADVVKPSAKWDFSAYANAPQATSVTVEVTVEVEEGLEDPAEDAAETETPNETPETEAMAQQRRNIAALRLKPPA